MNNNSINLLLAIIISTIILFSWRYFYEQPKINNLTQQSIEKKINKQYNKVPQQENISNDDKEIPHITIISDSVSGSISLKGLRFDNLTLLKYYISTDINSKNVQLLAEAQTKNSYFAEIGWTSSSADSAITYPDSNTIWQVDDNKLTPNKEINAYWINPQKVKFVVTISMDNDYLFTIKQKIFNNSPHIISFQHYGLINKNYHAPKERIVNVFHQGMIGSVNGELQEYTYKDIMDKNSVKYPKSQIDWFGITDKYWLTAFIPDTKLKYSANYINGIKNNQLKFQSSFISEVQYIKQGNSYELVHKLFAGAKKVDLLDKYEKLYNIKLFDRAIDFGWFYIITKPIFYAMNFFYAYVGNFGISIMIVTVIIKLLMFTLANKSYLSMKKIKALQPEIEYFKKLYGNNKIKLNEEIMALYKREKVNPVTGCLPLIVQIPVFFSIYKVLYVTIEMRHAPFFGWVKDLSASDPTNIFNLFGLLPLSVFPFFTIGVWPIIMAITMFYQQKMNPQPTDPLQAKVMQFMPLIFLFMFNNFPVGLLIYWSWSNILSIIQQYYINNV